MERYLRDRAASSRIRVVSRVCASAPPQAHADFEPGRQGQVRQAGRREDRHQGPKARPARRGDRDVRSLVSSCRCVVHSCLLQATSQRAAGASAPAHPPLYLPPAAAQLCVPRPAGHLRRAVHHRVRGDLCRAWVFPGAHGERRRGEQRGGPRLARADVRAQPARPPARPSTLSSGCISRTPGPTCLRLRRPVAEVCPDVASALGDACANPLAAGWRSWSSAPPLPGRAPSCCASRASSRAPPPTCRSSTLRSCAAGAPRDSRAGRTTPSR